MGDMVQYVAYYRVSTDRQGETRLGLDAQRAAVARYVRDAPILAEYQEIESGKRHNNRPQLAAALVECRRRRATLIIATLDRLARNVHFISGLMESGVPFIAADAPEDGPFILHMRAAYAEEESRKISQRTRAALAEVKRRGGKLGNPRWQEALPLAWEARRGPVRIPPQVIDLMQQQRAEGKTLRAIVAHLDDMGIRTPRGYRWHPETIRDILNRPQQEPANA
jgi:DNA invertase Pin-like site-specific DNA recombinase